MVKISCTQYKDLAIQTMDVASPSSPFGSLLSNFIHSRRKFEKKEIEIGKRERDKNVSSERKRRKKTRRTLWMSWISAALGERDDGKETTTIILSFLQLSLSPNNTHSWSVFNVYSNTIPFSNREICVRLCVCVYISLAKNQFTIWFDSFRCHQICGTQHDCF